MILIVGVPHWAFTSFVFVVSISANTYPIFIHGDTIILTAISIDQVAIITFFLSNSPPVSSNFNSEPWFN
jgi:hypothetical protein